MGEDAATAAPMLADMARQPAVLRALLGRRGAFLDAGRRMAPGPGGRLYVVGCGDGLFAAEAAAGFAAGLGLDWRPIGALDLVLAAGRLTPADRVIAISMSGNVDRTVEAAQAAAAAGVPLLALVNGAGGRLGEIAGAKVSLDIPDIAPFLCGTATYTATVAALMMLAAGAAAQDAAVGRLDGVPGLQEEALAAESSPPGALAPLPRGVRLLSAGADAGTVRYGAAKFVELTALPAWAGDLEEFAHSQFWAMPRTDQVIVVSADPALAPHADAACAALAELPVATLAIETHDAPVPSAFGRIVLPRIEADLAPLVTALPLQRIAYEAALACGLDPNTRLHLKQDETRFRVSRLLTRRSLLGTGQ